MAMRGADGRFLSGGGAGGIEFSLRAKTWLNQKEVVERVRKAAVERLGKCAALVEAEAKKILSSGATFSNRHRGDGKDVRVYDRNSGEFPRLISGNLRNSIRFEKTAEGTYIVGPTTTAFYGRVHEFGAVIRVTAKMRSFLKWNFGWQVGQTIIIKKRPFMRPALDRVAARMPELFRDLPLGGPVSEKNT